MWWLLCGDPLRDARNRGNTGFRMVGEGLTTPGENDQWKGRCCV